MARLAAAVVAVPWLSAIHGNGPFPGGRKLVTTMLEAVPGTGTLCTASRSLAQRRVELAARRGRSAAEDDEGQDERAEQATHRHASTTRTAPRRSGAMGQSREPQWPPGSSRTARMPAARAPRTSME